MPEGSNVFDPEPEKKRLGALGWARVSGVVAFLAFGALLVGKTGLESLANNPLGDNLMAPNPYGPTPEPTVEAPKPSPVTPPVETPSAPEQQAPVEAEAAKPPEVEQQVAEKPKVEPRELEGVAEARELNLKELARHANYQGTVVKDGVTYDVWKSKNHDLTHLLPHRG